MLRDRKKTVEALLELKRGGSQDTPTGRQSEEAQEKEERSGPALRRYFNE